MAKLERFYLLNFEDALTGSELHHLVHVLRLREGDQIELVNGKGSLAHARIERIQKTGAHLTLIESTQEPRPTPSLHIGLPLLRLAKLEWAIEKGTELGADAFYLFPAQRSEHKTLSPHALNRLLQIVISSLKQCKRLYLPELLPVQSLSQLLDFKGTILFGDPIGSPFSSPPDASSILFISGPEGGFSPEELELLRQKNAQGVKLHRNILRAETAPLVALSLLQTI